MPSFAELPGPSLVASSDSKIKRFETRRTEEALAGKHVGLFFGAAWCAGVAVASASGCCHARVCVWNAAGTVCGCLRARRLLLAR
jgi:hypothetical protein